ncbi:uncharacterized protein LOC116145589 [Pistacia vera]|uniref:uncharacterized protein LOC116119955 n=1 Tax=Pistacia vera TaxID=55513 RepID=UPI0012630422|nr:uncharacterized protein LOC116119955 [Pistacia vera]XP_031286902.1 uncharacterized protein LOC116145589 [Pistacia vera]
MRAEEEQHQLRVFYELCSSIIEILKVKPILSTCLSSGHERDLPSSSRQPISISRVSPTAFASFLFGISLTLMLFGSVTFVVGFILMPWVLCSVLLLYLSGFLSNLSQLGRSFFCSGDVPAWNFS